MQEDLHDIPDAGHIDGLQYSLVTIHRNHASWASITSISSITYLSTIACFLFRMAGTQIQRSFYGGCSMDMPSTLPSLALTLALLPAISSPMAIHPDQTKKETEKERWAAQQYVKITDLLVEGKKGAKLETVIAEWEREVVTRLGVVTNPSTWRRCKTFRFPQLNKYHTVPSSQTTHAFPSRFLDQQYWETRLKNQSSECHDQSEGRQKWLGGHICDLEV
jgi:hypothetical protein